MPKLYTFSDQDLYRQLTVGIKTFHRPQCLQHCVSSIRSQFKDLRILVADDSDDGMKQHNQSLLAPFEHVYHLELPFNSGLSYGRNRIVEQVNTPYFLSLDDDNFISEKTHLLKAVHFLERYKAFDLLAGICPERGILYNPESVDYSVCFEAIVPHGTQKIIKTQPNHIRISNPYLKQTYQTNLTLNLFIARTPLLKLFAWNETKKLGEHEEFFVELFQHNINCAISHDLIFGEILDERRNYDYEFPDNNIHHTYTKEYLLDNHM